MGISMIFDLAALSSSEGTALSNCITGADVCFWDVSQRDAFLKNSNGTQDLGSLLSSASAESQINHVPVTLGDCRQPSSNSTPASVTLEHASRQSSSNSAIGGTLFLSSSGSTIDDLRQDEKLKDLPGEVHALQVEVEELRFFDAVRRLDQNRDAWTTTASQSSPCIPAGNGRLHNEWASILKKAKSSVVDLEKGPLQRGTTLNQYEGEHKHDLELSNSRRSSRGALSFLDICDSTTFASIMSYVSFSKFSKELRDLRKRHAEFHREIRILSRLRHPCIVTVMGTALTSHQELLLVMECMELGSLHDLLHNKSFFLEGDLLLPMLSDVAQGMRFLHAAAEPIIHGDLKTGNVLVDSNFRAKIADIGPRHGLHVSTPAFMAPELLRRETGPTKESDVYAFGILLFEAFARETPYKGEDWVTLKKEIANNSPNAPLKRPPVPKGCPGIVSGLMQECWHREEESRPTFEEIDRRIRSLDVGCVTSQALEAAKKHQQRGSCVETVLFDMFPSHVAEALMQGKKVPPEEKEMVTVYFSDVVSFTRISSTITSAKVSDMLDRLYSKFDELALKHKVYKIETIGDAYIAVTNLFSDQDSTHAVNMARFAIEVQEAASATLIDSDDPSKGHIQIRIGLHSGPVVASVIGNKTPKYTLLGDTMNTASRMESNSQPGRIQCTKECAENIRTQDQPNKTVRVEERGTIYIKGKGNLETFWVQHAHSVALSRPGTLGNFLLFPACSESALPVSPVPDACPPSSQN